MNRNKIFFLLIFAITLLFAFFTDSRWEDWYITFRASKNLASGNGLVYTVGQKVYSFTSPIGTLIPALLSYITKNTSEDYVIWAYRVINAIVLSFSGMMLLNLSKRFEFNNTAVFFIAGLFSTSILIIDFSINGMETAYMMFFIVSIIYLLFFPGKKFYLKLGFCLAGIMYTRPDGFIYAGSIMLGVFIFHPTVYRRNQLIFQYLKAVGLCILIYLPWLIWTWSYYGSPIPHTIIAKALNHNYFLPYLVFKFLTLPVTILIKGYSADAVFMAPLYYLGGWHHLEVFSRILTCIGVFSVFFPFIDRKARALAFSLYILHFYIIFISGQSAMPWYIPNITIITIVCLGLILNQFHRSLKILKRPTINLNLIAGTCFFFSTFILLSGAWQIRLQQKLIEFDHRKQIGLWLRAHSNSNKETVFLECLGYIGYYSGLKMYDYPGMSSPEVVASRRKIKFKDYAFVVNDLKPDWLVLRRDESEYFNNVNPVILSDEYKKAKTFDVRALVRQQNLIFGEGSLMSDAYFDVYKRNK